MSLSQIAGKKRTFVFRVAGKFLAVWIRLVQRRIDRGLSYGAATLSSFAHDLY